LAERLVASGHRTDACDLLWKEFDQRPDRYLAYLLTKTEQPGSARLAAGQAKLRQYLSTP
jgi:hypothetical protein